MLVLFTDTDTDITPELVKEYGYNLISMPYNVDGKEVYPYKDFDKFNAHEFYDTLRKGVLPTTSGLSPADYKAYFEPHFIAGNDILYVHFSTAMSGTFSAMKIAIAELKEKYPDRKFYEIDTKGITICSYNIVRAVGDLYKAGKSIEEILAWAETEVDKFAIYFFATDLTFFKRSGRVKALAAFFGSIIGIKPIINMGSDGMMKSVDKGRGLKNTLSRIMDYVDELNEDMDKYRVIIGHSDSPEIAATLGEMVKEKYPNVTIEYVVVNPTAGSHCGPDGVGICFHAKHR